MASVYHLFDDAEDIADNVIANTEARFDLDKKRYFAALIIQRTFRGYVVRSELKRWNRAAIMIQKHMKGFLLRIRLPEIAAELFRRKCLALFNRMAKRIQSNWRGYWVRKIIRIKDILLAKKEERAKFEALMALFAKIFRRKAEGSSDFSLNLDDLPEHVRLLNRIIKKSPHIIESLFDRHHLLRTYQTEGVLSIHESKELSVLEEFMKKFDYKSYMSKVRKIFKSSAIPETEYMFTDKRARKIEDLIRLKNHRDGPLKKMEYMEKFKEIGMQHNKPFRTINKFVEKPYERTLISKEAYTGVQQPVFRDRIKPDISEHDFDLGVHHMEKNPKEEPPYLIDHWKKVCCNHNFMFDFMEERNG